eukprot:EG_transcript_35327
MRTKARFVFTPNPARRGVTWISCGPASFPEWRRWAAGEVHMGPPPQRSGRAHCRMLRSTEPFTSAGTDCSAIRITLSTSWPLSMSFPDAFASATTRRQCSSSTRSHPHCSSWPCSSSWIRRRSSSVNTGIVRVCR